MARTCQNCKEDITGTGVFAESANGTPVGTGFFCSNDCCYEYCKENGWHNYTVEEYEV
jgi:hypothetical protein